MELFSAGFGILLGQKLRFLCTGRRNRDGGDMGLEPVATRDRIDSSQTDGAKDGEGAFILEGVGGGGRRAEKD